MPAMKLVHPRRKKSQWKPPGFFNGNCFAWAVILLTFCPILSTSKTTVKINLTYVVKVKKKHHEKTNWHRHENPLDRQAPEVNEPASIDSRIERSGMWQSLDA